MSSNLGTMSLKDGNLDIFIHSRSNIEGRNEDLNNQFKDLCSQYGVKYEVASWYGCWEKAEDTGILDL